MVGNQNGFRATLLAVNEAETSHVWNELTEAAW
jgi:hypothetical protein